MDDPFTPEFDPGFDNATGFGFVDAREAIGTVYKKEKPTDRGPSQDYG